MISLERTAYPVLTAQTTMSQKTLNSSYKITLEEKIFIYKKIRGNRLRLCFALQLKTFENLKYFINLNDIPLIIKNHVKKELNINHNLKPYYQHQKTLSRHRAIIRNYLKVKSWSTKGTHSTQRTALQAAYTLSQTMNHPADIMNAVIQKLVEQNSELPAFNTLARLVCHVRSKVNQGIFKKVSDALEEQHILENMEKLLVIKKDEMYSDYQKLKKVPKAPTRGHFKEYLLHHIWLTGLGNMDFFVKDISKVKIKQFSEEAKTLDIDNLRDISFQKRYTLIACLLHQTQQTTKDALGSFFCKILFSIHKKAKRTLELLRINFAEQTQGLAKLMINMLTDFKEFSYKEHIFTSKFEKNIENQGGAEGVINLCEKIIAYNNKNHFPFLKNYYRGKRSVLFECLNALSFGSSTQNNHIIHALTFLKKHRYSRSDIISLDSEVILSFASEKWKNLVYVGNPKNNTINRILFELCVLSELARNLRSGDIFIEGADVFSDYRQHLLKWQDCELLLESYLEELKFPKKPEAFIESLKDKLLQKAKEVDALYPKLTDFIIDETGVPAFKKVPTIKPTKKTLKMVEKIAQRMPERRLLDSLCLTHHLTGWAYEFGHVSGVESRLDNPIERYILNAFCHGTGMGPTQGAKHIKNSIVTPHMLSWINQHHVTLEYLERSKDRVINYSHYFLLTTAWGDGSRCAADGTLRAIYEDNLFAETHFRYQAKGGIAYNHIADTYVALFSTFIPCGVWEAVEIIEGLLKNESTIKPDTIHADTQGQSTIVFGLSYLLGIKLMPRIRNWKELTFYRPNKGV